ncbi:unnamed protein product [Caenorhabditis angaria]|uniref:BPTI/Kunitz inhibitor domain-containing protein n=1 Tax=Caenorhabditis angaria TaxID=860376 RepID=A0A9P1MZ89_9PELO|nr:unnamed protein product [Caenorhabditis angaria]
MICFLLILYGSIINISYSIIPFSEGVHSLFSRNAEIRKLGESCSRTSQCVIGAVCHVTCRCKYNYVAIDEQCWKKVQPGLIGCTHSEQCEAVWPSTRCERGQCICPENEQLIETIEGNVCVSSGSCPTNGINGALYERATNRVANCFSFTAGPFQRKNFIGCDEYPEIYDCINGLCCPTRGMTCIQPMSVGDYPRGESFKEETRWFYNSNRGQCESFNYRGTGGNSNNFLTQDQCESYCENRCPRGDPITKMEELESYKCEEKSGIEDEHGKTLCCPIPSFICSSIGGVNLEKSALKPFSSGSPKKGSEIFHRWYWDSSELSCKVFKYYGQGGNFNNFVSKEECSGFCTTGLCPIGTPLQDPSRNIQRCSAVELCPDTHECKHTICCPKHITICSHNLVVMDKCDPKETITRWTYSMEHSMCKSILASSCLRGDNQFETLEQCQTVCSAVQAEPKCPIGRAYKSSDNIIHTCSSSKPCPPSYECVYTGSYHTCCPSREYTCRQPLFIGTSCGISSIQRWYYDENTNRCLQFDYLGCNANDNNFLSRIDCMENCHRSDCPDGGDALIDSTNGQIIMCKKNDECPSTHHCTRMLYQNTTSCCPSRKWICSQDADEGVACGSTSKRFYFDPSTETCRQFTYLGCSGNPNSFSTRSACYQFCQGASCSSSEIVYQPSNLDEPFDCSLKSCPRHFSCAKHVWNDRKRVCSSTQHPMIEYSSQQPMTCTPNSPISCPIGFQCTYSSIRSLYFCCRDIEKLDKCMKGSRPEIWQSTAEPRSCSKDSQCPLSTGCYTPIPFTSGLCCASVDDVCPATFIYEPEKSIGLECSPLDRLSCGNDGQSVCLYSEPKGRFVCCRREARQLTTLAKCPPGSIPELIRTHCDPEIPCPKTHFCMKKSSDRSGICCRHPNLKRLPTLITRKIATATRKPRPIRGKCPRSEKIYRVDGYIKDCLSDDDCPEFYKCTSQSNGRVAICCGFDMQDICPTRVFPTIRVQKCAHCGVGYECHRNYCCPQKDLVCSSPPPQQIDSQNNPKIPTVSRYFYDSETNTCHSFEYLPANGIRSDQPQNHFYDHESCIEMCVYSSAFEDETMCPAPYSNPIDHPQLCVPNRKSCADTEACIKTASDAYVCCKRPKSFKIIMHNLCGPNFLPFLDKSGNTVRCSSNAKCTTKICRKSPVLKHSICCQYSKLSTGRMILSSPLSDGLKKICEDENEKDCLKKLYAGESGCISDRQCVGSICLDGSCQCPPNTVLFRRMCASICPLFYKNENGICV